MSTSKWVAFVQRCLLQRMPGHEFQEFAGILCESYRLSGRKLVQIILECRQSFSSYSDPLISQYFRATVAAGLIEISDVLFVLVRNWNSPEPDHGLALEIKRPGSLSSPDASIVNDLALVIASNKPPISSTEAHKDLSLSSRWLVALIGWISDDAENRSYLAALTLLEALGILLASIISTEHGMLLLSNENDSDTRSEVTEALETTLPFLNSISEQLHTRLDMIQKHFNLFRSSVSKDASQLVQNAQSIPDALQFAASIADESNIHTRASLFLYFNAALCAPPTVDDAALIGYLNVRYAGDHISMFIDAIVAGFDVLSNGQARNEGEQAISVYRSFLMNRLPALLVLMSASSLQPVPASLCIPQALDRIDLSTFPVSAYDMERRSPLAGTRQEFLFACALHRLIPEDSVERLLGENPMQALPSHGLYDKEQLFQQVASNLQRGEQLVSEIELVEGNAGIAATVIIETMHSHCRNKETLQLKDYCNLLVRKPRILDVMAIFRRPGYILGPLCSLLDDWNWDELQGESQPVYDEFSAILLLILCVTHRYGLEPGEVGTASANSFVQHLLEMDAADEPLETLEESRQKRLGEWIAALFIADSLSDELTSSCSPHDFYQLVPTLLNQSIEACAVGKLSVEALNSGLDYLLEPFLLPSVLLGLQWLARDLWRSKGATAIKLSVLQSLVKGPSSTEAREVHKTLLSLIAEPLHKQLQAFGREDPEKQMATTIATSLAPYISSQRQRDWLSDTFPSSTTQSPGPLDSMVQSFHQLLNWSTALEVNIPPPKFTFKVILAAVQSHGSPIVITVFLKELKMLTGTSKFDAAIDIIASIICAPLPSVRALSHRLSLHDALNIIRANVAKMLKKGDAELAGALVRLHQRVESLSAGLSQQDVAVDPDTTIGPDLSTMGLQNISLDATAGNAQIDVGAMGVPPIAEDIGQILETTANMEHFGTNGMDAVADDVFGLDGADMQMMNFDEMDLEGMFS